MSQNTYIVYEHNGCFDITTADISTQKGLIIYIASSVNLDKIESIFIHDRKLFTDIYNLFVHVCSRNNRTHEPEYAMCSIRTIDLVGVNFFNATNVTGVICYNNLCYCHLSSVG